MASFEEQVDRMFAPDESSRATRLRKEKEAIDASLHSTGGAMAQGAKEGFFGPLQTMADSVMPPEYLQAKAEESSRHALAKGASELGAFIGGAVTGTGLGGIIAGLGRGGAALGLKTGSKVASKMAGSITEGVGISLSEAHGKSAVDRAMGQPGAGIELANAAGEGIAWGGGFGVASVVMPAAANFLFKKTFNKRILAVGKANKERMVAGQEYNALTAELEALMAETTPSIRRTFRINKLTGGEVTRKTPGHLPGSGAEFVYGEKSLIDAAKKTIQNADSKISRTLYGALDDAAEATRSSMTSLLVDGALLASGGPSAVMLRHIMKPTVDAAQARILSGLMHLKPIKALMGSSLQAGRISSKKMVRSGSQLVHSPHRYEKYMNAGPKFVAALKLPAIQSMSNDELEEVSNEIVSFDPQQYEQSARLSMAAKGIPQEAAGPLISNQMRVNQYLMEHLPYPRKSSWIAREKAPMVRESERRAFASRLRAAQIPATVLADFLSGELTSQAADAWWRTQPEAADYLAERIRNTINIATVYGRVFPPEEKLYYGLMVDPTQAKIGRTKTFPMVQSLQSNFSDEAASTPPPQVGGPKPPGDPGAVEGIHKQTSGGSAGLTKRLTER